MDLGTTCLFFEQSRVFTELSFSKQISVPLVRSYDETVQNETE